MRRLLPRSLAGQMALLIGIALLIAQLANFALILNERQKLSLARAESPALAAFARTTADLAAAAPEFTQAVLDDNSRHGARFAIDTDSAIADAERDAGLEGQARAALASAGAPQGELRAARGAARDDPRRRSSRVDFLRIAIKRPDGHWLKGQFAVPRRDPLLAIRLGAATLLLYLLVLGASIWIAIRIARPLRDLTLAADRFAGKADPVEIAPSGPDDVAHAIAAFNAMNRRVVALLDEKDHMLGAIGHDLRTPLASLRIRIESMEPEEERTAAIAKIEEMTAMLEDILVLARTGRAREEVRPVDIAVLAETVVDDYRDRGQPVSFAATPRQVAEVQPDLLRRALRNLIDNAIKYGGGAEVSVTPGAIRIVDHGPGIPAAELDRVLQPFHRLESSRNRDSGGSGLGLAIARSIVEAQGGRLKLEPTAPTGLTALILLSPQG
jgi:signal transduction histidine kinase